MSDISADMAPKELHNKTICGDSFALMPLLPDSCVDLAIVDPPYNLSKRYAGATFSSTTRTAYERYTVSWLNLLLPLLKPTASLYICCDWKSSISISHVLTEYEAQKKLKLQNRITWQREKGRGARSNWKNSMEDIWFCTIGDTYTFNLNAVKQRRKVIAPYREQGRPKDWKQTKAGCFRDTCPSNFWDDISIPFWSMAENTAHPTQKPEKLLAKLILASSNSGDLVFDPFLGSGTTSVAAKKLGRQYLGIEQSELYCTWAEKRLADAEHTATIQGYTDGVFWERNTVPFQHN
ncbi:MAG: site-specific DNA-methyltransferase [Treponema sp.]|nr:site-specific DNA-methyltransferase [Treponema sp.]